MILQNVIITMNNGERIGLKDIEVPSPAYFLKIITDNKIIKEFEYVEPDKRIVINPKFISTITYKIIENTEN